MPLEIFQTRTRDMGICEKKCFQFDFVVVHQCSMTVPSLGDSFYTSKRDIRVNWTLWICASIEKVYRCTHVYTGCIRHVASRGLHNLVPDEFIETR